MAAGSRGPAGRIRWYGGTAERLAGAGLRAGIGDELRATAAALGAILPSSALR